MVEMNAEQCPRCKRQRNTAEFFNDRGRRLKTCQFCRNKSKEWNHRNVQRCRDNAKRYYHEHKVLKPKKTEAEVEEMLKRRRERACVFAKRYYFNNHERCKERNRERQKVYCQENPQKIRIINMVSHGRIYDIKRGFYDANTHIDRPFIEQLLHDLEGKCVYCQSQMSSNSQTGGIDKTLMTIERIDNTQSHSKNNCTLCCMRCNATRANRYSFEEFLMMKYPLW